MAMAVVRIGVIFYRRQNIMRSISWYGIYIIRLVGTNTQTE